MTDNGVVVYPTAAIRALAEATATDTTLTPAEQSRELEALLDDVTRMGDEIAAYLAEARKRETGERDAADERMFTARENADIREELVRREMATAEQLDERGYASHAELDAREADGTIELFLEEALGRAFGLGLLSGSLFNRRVLRSRGGRFEQLPGEGDVKRVFRDKRGHEYKVYPVRKVRPQQILDSVEHGIDHPAMDPRTKQQLAERAHGARNDPGQNITTAALDASAAAGVTVHPTTYDQTYEAIRARNWEKRAKAEEKRVNREVKREESARVKTGEHPFLNAQEKVSSRRLIGYAAETATMPTTAEQHSTLDDKGVRHWDADRHALHVAIAQLLLRKRDKNGNLCATCDKIPSQDHPEVFFTGGGYGSGKTSLLRSGLVDVPPDAVKIDPDEIKALLPEYQRMVGGDPEANLVAYEEAWDVAQWVMGLARSKRTNLIIDGISDTSADEMLARVDGFRRRDYKARVVYADLPLEIAAESVARRAREAKRPEDRRMIPDSVLRAVHRDVAATIPELMKRASDFHIDVEVWDMRERGKPHMTAYVHGNEHKVVDRAMFDAMRAKGRISIDGVRDPALDLPENHNDYFFRFAGAKDIPIDKLVAAHEKPESIISARAQMHRALRLGTKRAPIEATDNGDGTYTIVDGNSTFGAARAAGWKSLPVVIRDPKRAEVETAIVDAIDPAEATQHGDKFQPTNDFEKLYTLAESTQDKFTALLEKTGAEFGADIGPMGADNPENEKTAEKVLLGRDRHHTIVGDVKRKSSAKAKAEKKYKKKDGVHYDQLGDLVRGTHLVPSYADVPTYLAALRRHMKEDGWTLVPPIDNRMVQKDGEPRARGPLSSGYSDLSMNVRSPDGVVAELQINVPEMWIAKELGHPAGHDLYDEEKALYKLRDDRPLSEQEIERLSVLHAQMDQLYKAARETAFARRDTVSSENQ